MTSNQSIGGLPLRISSYCWARKPRPKPRNCGLSDCIWRSGVVAGALGNLLATFISSPLRTSPRSGDGIAANYHGKEARPTPGPIPGTEHVPELPDQAGEYLPLAASHFSLVIAEKP